MLSLVLLAWYRYAVHFVSRGVRTAGRRALSVHGNYFISECSRANQLKVPPLSVSSTHRGTVVT